MRDASARTTAEAFISRVVLRHGCPQLLLSDQGANFRSLLVDEVAQLCRARKVFTTPYHPQSDGLNERIHEPILRMLRTLVSDENTDWDQFLPYVQFAYNASVQVSTNESPFYLVHGRDARIPIDLKLAIYKQEKLKSPSDYALMINARIQKAWKLTRQHIAESQLQQKRQYDRKAQGKDIRAGEAVWMTNHSRDKASRKLRHTKSGPFRVLEIDEKNAKIVPTDRPASEGKWV